MLNVLSLSAAPKESIAIEGLANGTYNCYFIGDVLPSWAIYDPVKADALEAQNISDSRDCDAARTHAKLKALSGMTPAQVHTWVTNNVTTLAAAQDAIATLAVAVSILARRL